MPDSILFSIQQGDIRSVDSDVVIVKYAQAFYSSDAAVAQRLTKAGIRETRMRPAIGHHALIETQRAIAAPYALWVGVPDLENLGYAQLREFASRSFAILRDELPNARRVAITFHGRYGLDEAEALLSILAGCREALAPGGGPAHLVEVALVEIDGYRAGHLEDTARAYFSGLGVPSEGAGRWRIPARLNLVKSQVSRDSAGVADPRPETKRHVFVAMPFEPSMLDVFFYGIQRPVRKAGFLCERVDTESFTGDILAHVKRRIEAATLVIADLTHANPNVYLEVGYAWGKDRPTVLVASKDCELRFDVRGQRCIIYESIQHLDESLARELDGLTKKGVIDVAA